jgi:hypothetical protein
MSSSARQGSGFGYVLGLAGIVALVYFLMHARSDSPSGQPDSTSTDSVESQKPTESALGPVAVPTPAQSLPLRIKRGDSITLIASCPLRFHDQVYSQGKIGEEFEVADYRADTHRVYILFRDANGNPFALNVDDSNVRLKPSLSASEAGEKTGPTSDYDFAPLEVSVAQTEAIYGPCSREEAGSDSNEVWREYRFCIRVFHFRDTI